MSKMSEREFTTGEKVTNEATRAHIQRVAQLLHEVVVKLLERVDNHDKSKLSSPELEVFTVFGVEASLCC